MILCHRRHHPFRHHHLHHVCDVADDPEDARAGGEDERATDGLETQVGGAGSQNTQNIQNTKNTQNIQNTQNSQNS